MRELALFAGAGGGLLGSLFLGWKTVCAVEIEEYPRRVLLARQRDGALPRFPIWDDVQTFNGREWRGRIDVVTGGFPCQPFSITGKRQAKKDNRNMWPDTIRVIKEIRPKYCFLENVPGLFFHPYFGTILRNLAESGYNIKWKLLSAAEVGAPHYRNRLWIFAFSNGFRWDVSGSFSQVALEARFSGNSTQQQFIMVQGERQRLLRELMGRAATPEIDGKIDGVDSRLDRLRAVGNGQVPQVFKKAWEILSKGVLEK